MRKIISKKQNSHFQQHHFVQLPAFWQIVIPMV